MPQHLSNEDIRNLLNAEGYLSLYQMVRYLHAYAPEAAMSYPTARKRVLKGNIQAIRRGSVYYITKSEIERWISEGNYEKSVFAPYPQMSRTNL